MRGGSGIVTQFVNDLFSAWKNVEDYSYLSLCMQGMGVGVRLESIRRTMPTSMGSLYWQFNDVWPVFSWSSIDYYGQWKPLHYIAKRLYANVVLSVKLVEGNFNFIIPHANYISIEGGESTIPP